MPSEYRLKRRVQFYEQTGLPQAAVIVRLSQRAYKAGETTYSELLLNLERALSVRTAYLDALLQHNQTAIDLDYLCRRGFWLDVMIVLRTVAVVSRLARPAPAPAITPGAGPPCAPPPPPPGHCGSRA